MTFSYKIQAKTYTWPDVSFYMLDRLHRYMLEHFICSIGYIDRLQVVPNKGIEQACSWASCDTHIRPFSINIYFSIYYL